jgi:glutamate-5-semialdehyde dehydrogenase
MSTPTRRKPEALQDVGEAMRAIGAEARAAARALALASTEAKNAALHAAARELRARTAAILDANGRDLDAARAARRPGSFLDRLALDPRRVEAMAKGLEDIAALPDPVGAVLAAWTRPNGLKIARVRVPLGVIGIVYESRPNVTADAGASRPATRRSCAADRRAIIPAAPSMRASRAASPRRACRKRRSSWCRPPTAKRWG